MKTYTKAPAYRCPNCDEDGVLSYVWVPEHIRQYENEEGEEVTELFDKARDFSCSNCGCEFTMTRKES